MATVLAVLDVQSGGNVDQAGRDEADDHMAGLDTDGEGDGCDEAGDHDGEVVAVLVDAILYGGHSASLVRDRSGHPGHTYSLSSVT